MAKQALFYFGFGPRIGLGHAVRCAALADALKADGWQCAALATGLPAFLAPSFDAPAPAQADVFVVDHYEPDAALLEHWRARAGRVLPIRDAERQNADALVRGAFAARRPLARGPDERREMRRVLVMPGSTDVGGICRTLAARRDRAYTFVLSRLAPDFDEVSRLAGAQALVADADASAIAELMLSHDLVVGAGGGGAWERCTLGAPSITVVVADNQRDNARVLGVRGATLLAGDAAEVERLLGGSPDLRGLSEGAFALTDGLGAYRAALALAPESVALRPAAAGDCERIYRWQQDPATRRYARNPAAPGLQEHTDWFAAKLRDHRCIFSLVVHQGREAGVVRLDYREQRQGKPCYEVSIFVDPARHGGGIGAAALRAVRRLTPFAWRRAFVDARNAASVALFARAGYRTDGAFLYDPPTC